MYKHIDDCKFKDIVDIDKLKVLMGKFYSATKIPVGLISTDHEILVGTGWQRICTDFHRVNPQTLQKCYESDDFIRKYLHTQEFVHYKCHNGLWDIAFPIVIESRHLATLFVGQFFL